MRAPHPLDVEAVRVAAKNARAQHDGVMDREIMADGLTHMACIVQGHHSTFGWETIAAFRTHSRARAYIAWLGSLSVDDRAHAEYRVIDDSEV